MKVLIIEDHHKIANSVKKGLEQENFAVDVTFDGTNGFNLAVTEDYDVIILDLMLPGMDGLQICQKLREEENIHTPILILTAKDQINERVKGLNLGADDYLTKPFAFNELLARIKALGRRPKKTLKPTLKIAGLVLDTVSYEVSRNNKIIKLSKKEYSLLEYLIRNKNKVLTKNQIINHVWDYDADVLPNTVEVYIGYLRNKIDRPFPNNKSLIKTVRGFGYKIGE